MNKIIIEDQFLCPPATGEEQIETFPYDTLSAKGDLWIKLTDASKMILLGRQELIKEFEEIIGDGKI